MTADQGGTDLGRRIREHRDKAGLSRDEAAAGAGMAVSYLHYLETSPDAAPTPAALARLAAALGTSTHAITGVGAGLTPGHQPLLHPVLEVLTTAECRAFLGDGGIGRFLFHEDRGPVAVPVNFAMLGDDVVFRTPPESPAVGATDQQRVSFEVDHLDEALGEGWSVLVTGHAHPVTAPAELDEVEALQVAPWAGGPHDVFIRLVPAVVTGRRIRAAVEGDLM
jgi:nitroimidazol reductase NimA-like FMN-containing flavoprotein (pyridoxamine 5'-phosphate oxidase superfamily)